MRVGLKNIINGCCEIPAWRAKTLYFCSYHVSLSLLRIRKIRMSDEPLIRQYDVSWSSLFITFPIVKCLKQVCAQWLACNFHWLVMGWSWLCVHLISLLYEQFCVGLRNFGNWAQGRFLWYSNWRNFVGRQCGRLQEYCCPLCRDKKWYICNVAVLLLQ